MACTEWTLEQIAAEMEKQLLIIDGRLFIQPCRMQAIIGDFRFPKEKVSRGKALNFISETYHSPIKKETSSEGLLRKTKINH